MKRILRWFAAFQTMERELSVAVTRAEVAEATVQQERARADVLQEELLFTLRRTADAMARQATGRNVFEMASAAPPTPSPNPTPTVSAVPTGHVLRQRAKNQREIEKHLQDMRKTADAAIQAGVN